MNKTTLVKEPSSITLKDLRKKVKNDPNLSIISRRQLWEKSNIQFFKEMGIRNKTYLLIYQYLLDHFHVNSKNSCLEMSNKQVQDGINKDLRQKNVPYHIGLSQISRAIARLTNDLIILPNNSPYLKRIRFGKHGCKSKMTINKIMLPTHDDLSHLLLVHITKLTPRDEKMDKLNKEYKRLQFMQQDTTKKLHRIIRKRKYVFELRRNLQ